MQARKLIFIAASLGLLVPGAAVATTVVDAEGDASVAAGVEADADERLDDAMPNPDAGDGGGPSIDDLPAAPDAPTARMPTTSRTPRT